MSAEASGRLRRAARAWRGHWLFLLLFAGGAALRATAWAAYRPGLAFYADSYQYLQAAADLSPPLDRPLGYPLLLRGLSLVGPVEVVPAVQHVLGLAAGVGVYALLLRRSCRRWVAALASAPLLLDAYQVGIERFLLSEMLFSVLLLGLLALVLLQRQPSTVVCIAMGVLAAVCTLTRTVALPLAVLLAVALVLRRVGARRVAVYATAVALPLLGYAAWFSSTHGTFGLERIGGRMVYGKVAAFADCSRLPLVGDARVLCDPPPPSGRSPNYYTWQPSSPAGRLSSPFATTAAADAAYRSFARTAVQEQPREYLRGVARDLVHYARPGRVQRSSDAKLLTWQFFTAPPPRYTSAVTPVGFGGEPTEPRLHVPAASVLRSYQRVGFTPGTVLALCGLAAAGAALWPGGDRRLRLDCALLAGIGLVLVVVPAMTVASDYRFLLPHLVVLPVAAALASLRLDPAARTPVPPTPPVHPPDTARRASGSPGHRESTGTHAEEDAVTDGREPENAELTGLRAERDRLQRRLDVVRWRVTALRTRRAWRLHAALAEARTGGRGLLLLPGRLLRVLFGPPVVVPPPHS